MFSFGYYPSPYMKYGYGFADAHISDPSDKYKGDHVTRWRTEEARLLEIHRAVTEYSVVKNLTTNYITLTVEATQDKNWNEAVRNSYLLDILVNDLKNTLIKTRMKILNLLWRHITNGTKIIFQNGETC